MEFKSIHHATDHGLEMDKKLSPKKLVMLIVGLLCAFVLLTAGAVWVFSRLDNNPLAKWQQQVKTAGIDFPVYYPKDLPREFTFSNEPVETHGGMVFYSLKQGDKVVIVSQQTRPPLMEEVTKTQEFTTNAGQAYIADLNGRLAGFLVTPETLIIATSSESIDANVLRQLIEVLTPLK